MAGEFGGYQFSKVGLDGGQDRRMYDVQTSLHSLGHFPAGVADADDQRGARIQDTVEAVAGVVVAGRGVAHSTGSGFARRSPILGILTEYSEALR